LWKAHDGLALVTAACRTLADSVDPGAGRLLQADYDQLFVAPDHLPVPPWESVYRTSERLVFDWPTLQVRDEYRRMDIATTRPADPDDHVGLELLFMGILCEREAAGDIQAALAQANATTDLFRGLAPLTRGVLAQDLLPPGNAPAVRPEKAPRPSLADRAAARLDRAADNTRG